MNYPPKYTYSWFTNSFNQAIDRAEQLVLEVDEELFLQRPAPDKWSAAECLNHLTEFGNIYYNTINDGLEQAATNSAAPDQAFRARLLWQWIIRFFEPPYKIKLKTIPSFEPRQQQEYSTENVLKSFSSLQNRFVEQLKQSEQKGIDLDAQKVGNPVLSFIKMRLTECYAIAEAHQRRHLWQAEQTIRLLEKA